MKDNLPDNGNCRNLQVHRNGRRIDRKFVYEPARLTHSSSNSSSLGRYTLDVRTGRLCQYVRKCGGCLVVVNVRYVCMRNIRTGRLEQYIRRCSRFLILICLRYICMRNIRVRIERLDHWQCVSLRECGGHSVLVHVRYVCMRNFGTGRPGLFGDTGTGTELGLLGTTVASLCSGGSGTPLFKLDLLRRREDSTPILMSAQTCSIGERTFAWMATQVVHCSRPGAE